MAASPAPTGVAKIAKATRMISRWGATDSGLEVAFQIIVVPKITKAATTGPSRSRVINSVPERVVVALTLRLAISSLASASSSRMSSSSSATVYPVVFSPISTAPRLPRLASRLEPTPPALSPALAWLSSVLSLQFVPVCHLVQPLEHYRSRGKCHDAGNCQRRTLFSRRAFISRVHLDKGLTIRYLGWFIIRGIISCAHP